MSLEEDVKEKRFIGIRKVMEIAGMSKTTIQRRIRASTFPHPVIAVGNCVRWDYAEVMDWRTEQFRKRDSGAKIF